MTHEPYLMPTPLEARTPEVGPAARPADPIGDWPTMAVLRSRYIHSVLAHHGNNKTHAAEQLGIDRRTLNRILARERAQIRRAEGVSVTH